MKSTVIHQSKAYPGVSYEVHRIGPRQRVAISLGMADVDAKLQGLYIDRAVKQQQINALIKVEVDRLKAKTPEEINQGDWSQEMIDAAKEIQVLNGEIELLNEQHIKAGWLKGGLVAITGGGYDGMTPEELTEELMEFGPTDLADEIYETIISKKGLTLLEAENLSSLTTSGASGEAKHGIAPSASSAEISSAETATV